MLTDRDKKIIEKYERMPYLVDDRPFPFLGVVSLVIVLIGSIGFVSVVTYLEDVRMQEYAESIHYIQTADVTCGDLNKELEHTDYNHFIKRKYIYDRMVVEDCITKYEAEELYRSDICLYHNTLECRLSRIADSEHREPRGKR